VDRTAAVREVVEAALANLELEVVDVELRRGLLRVVLDRVGGIDLDALTEASHRISAALDRADPIPGSYHLEVSSPGLERPLRTPEQFRRVVGSTVSVRAHGSAGLVRLRGRLVEADDDGVVLAVPGRGDAAGSGRGDAGQAGSVQPGEDAVRLLYRDIEKARTVFEWGPTAPPRRAGAGVG
jgi:ribosome maturation factor RimP